MLFGWHCIFFSYSKTTKISVTGTGRVYGDFCIVQDTWGSNMSLAQYPIQLPAGPLAGPTCVRDEAFSVFHNSPQWFLFPHRSEWQPLHEEKRGIALNGFAGKEAEHALAWFSNASAQTSSLKIKERLQREQPFNSLLDLQCLFKATVGSHGKCKGSIKPVENIFPQWPIATSNRHGRKGLNVLFPLWVWSVKLAIFREVPKESFPGVICPLSYRLGL